MQRKHNPKLSANARVLRKDMTPEERHLWYDFLRLYPVRFLRQKVIDAYIVDFYCSRARLVIELDGSQHYEEKGLLKDKIRTGKIENRNLTVLRIPNNEINQNFEGVCEYIDLCVKESLHQPGGWSPADCQASATLFDRKSSVGESQPRHFLGRELIRSTT